MTASRPIARAPIRVAIASASRAGSAVGLLPAPFASNAARRSSSNMSRSLFDAGPSVPMPTAIPCSIMLATGAMPEPSFRLLVGLCATPACASFSVVISPPSMWTQCAASTWASNNRCFFTHGITGIPCSRRDCSTSVDVSARCV